MFQLNNDLKTKLEQGHTIENQQEIWAEWNLNQSYNISLVGNYRYRPGSKDIYYSSIRPVYDVVDPVNNAAGFKGYYTGATDSDTVVNAGFADTDLLSQTLLTYTTPKQKIKLMYSLEDCFKQNRPRSGINKLLYLGVSGQYLDDITAGYRNGTVNYARRPRYYMSSRYDDFKYWTSFRTEVSTDVNNLSTENPFGLSLTIKTGNSYYIYDAAPFVVYNNPVPANRVTIKMQTNVGDVDNGPFRIDNVANQPDPFYGLSNRTVPSIWRIQALDSSNNWIDLMSFSESSVRNDGSPVIGSDGQVEIEYGLIIPDAYVNTYTFAGEVFTPPTNDAILPLGYAYLYKTSSTDKGVLYISDGGSWQTYDANYTWILSGTDITKDTHVLKTFNNPPYYVSGTTKIFREFQMIYGLRIVVDTMNKANCTFDLIELSPRLVGNVTEKIQSFTITKTLSDLGTYSLPTGSLLASTGTISIFDDDLTFNEQNIFDPIAGTGSVVSQYSNGKIKFLFYDIVKNVNEYDYYMPIKTMYSETIPQVSDAFATLTFNVRDLFYFLESKKSPEMLLTNVSLSYAVTTLLDSIGFSNYVFKRTADDEELIIPFFFVGPNQNIAESLQQLAISSQSAMFFDEYNNLVIMSKNYLLPTTASRSTDMTLYGKETVVNGSTMLPNIINIASQEKKTFNGGVINYTTRYIQKSIGSIAQAPYIAESQNYVYKPVLLWEVAGQQDSRTINESAQTSSGYSLSAMPLKTDLPATIPTVGYTAYSVLSKTRLGAATVVQPLDTVILEVAQNIDFATNSNITVNGVDSTMDGSWSVLGSVDAADLQAFLINAGLTISSSTSTTLNNYFNNSNNYYIIYQTNTYGDMTKTSVTGGTLTSQPISNATLDFGESVYYLGNYAGYFYANGEIIRYDAVEYSVAGVGNVWIENNQQYQDYFAKLSFNGKMYPTGNVRIYTNIQDGIVITHGRGQFGTPIVEHTAGIPSTSTWVDDNYIHGSIQDAQDYLFNTNQTINYPSNTGVVNAGFQKVINNQTYLASDIAKKATRNSVIKNFMANTNITESSANYYKSALSGTVQSSALVFNGPTVPDAINPVNFVSYAYKPLQKPYSHFGTRVRVIGRVEQGSNVSQTPVGAFNIYSPSSVMSTDPAQQVSITGGSGGIAFSLNKDTNVGYYFEIAALSQTSISSYKNNSNVINYSVSSSTLTTATNDLVTVTLTTPHEFNIGDSVAVAGLIDDNNKTNGYTTLNGEFIITQISSDRKQFQYQITPPTITSASITAVTRTASGSNWLITYTANNNFSTGQQVTITGLAPTAYNVVKGIVTSATTSQFIVTVSADPGTPTITTGTATYNPLTTTSSSGGDVSKSLTSDSLISDVFFYKIVSGYNAADIIQVERSAGSTNSPAIVTLYTLRDHSFVQGEQIIVSNIGFGSSPETYTITNIPDSRSIQYQTNTTDTAISLNTLSPLGSIQGINTIAIPKILWRGFAGILIDDGKFTSQARLTTSEVSTVYDLSAEYVDNTTTRTFYLYINGQQVAVATDDSPLPIYNNMALFVRGNSRIMFENVYALSDNFSESTAKLLQAPVSQIFNTDSLTESNGLQRYSLSGMVQSTYLSGISAQNDPKYDLYYEEFGTIMREAAYFNIKYDRAFPALYAVLAPTFNRTQGYTVSGFYAGSYGAEFLIFNNVDKNINLDDTSGNYLRILGISFTQNTTHSLTVDDYFKKNSNFTDSIYSGSNNAGQYQKLYTDILNSRSKYGQNDFSINAQYVQTTAAAESMMDWTIKRVIYPKRTVGVVTFATPHLQLGDIVQISHSDFNGIPYVAPENTRFVVYNIEYQKGNGAVTTTVHLAEV
jgi:hypothetical protein